MWDYLIYNNENFSFMISKEGFLTCETQNGRLSFISVSCTDLQMLNSTLPIRLKKVQGMYD